MLITLIENLEQVIRHNDDATSIKLWVDEMKGCDETQFYYMMQEIQGS